MAESTKKKKTAASGKSSAGKSEGTKKKSTASKKSASSGQEDSVKSSPKEKKTEEKGHGKNRKNQFWSIILFALGILIFLMAVIEGTAGWNAIHNFLLGVFGISVFFVPVVFIYTAVLIGLEKSQECVSGRAGWGVALTFLISSVIQIFGVGKIPGSGFFSNVTALYRAGKQLKGGGVASLLISLPLLKIFGKTGTQIIIVILFFVFVMLLSGKGLIEFLELLSRPFRFIWKCIIGLKNVITGGDFEDAFDDDEEKKDFEADMEAIDLVNKKNTRKSAASRSKEDDTEERDFLFDVPLPTDNVNAAAESGKTEGSDKGKAPKAAEEEIFLDENGEPQPPVEALDVLISQAADSAQKQGDFPSEYYEPPAIVEEAPKPQYKLPSLDFLTPPDNRLNSEEASAEMHEKAEKIVNTLKSFGVTVRICNICRGPSITRYELQPGAGVKVSKIKGLEDDIALNLAASGVRIEAPVPGKAAVGIEVPNAKRDMVTLREILASPEFRSTKSKLTFAVGKDIAGNVILGDVAKMPHVIIAGTTGSGKSVCTRSIIMSILYNATPDEVKLILIDPKIVEFKTFDGIPHLLIPIVTDSKKAAGALNWAVNEMMRRYQMFAEDGANDIKSYNELAETNEEVEKIPQIVIFIDELADMMLVAGKEVEDSICRLAQMGRAAGMHLVVATQRPTTDVITGLIKANIPSRIALSVMSQVDSRTIIDQAGADKLLGNGDMLYMPIGTNKPVRVQGCFASSSDIDKTIKFIKEQVQGDYDEEIIQAVESLVPVTKNDRDSIAESPYAAGSDEDYIERAMAVAVDNGQLSTSMLQRKLKLGYARAARIMDELEEMGVIGPSEGAKPRKVLMSRMQLDERRARMKSE
ncbi:MAG: DNA translocase FtsK [Ruminococcus sp.]|nr:DNA translocase FtsK [Ruminococcus sp.]